MAKSIKNIHIHVGIDFDNTIVIYDKVFHKYARKLGLLSASSANDKRKIRDAIRLLPNGNDDWTRLQGLVYGVYMDEAEPAKGVEDFLRKCQKKQIKVSIISHKTIYPALGPEVNLQEVAYSWLRKKDFFSRLGLEESDVVFKQTIAEKLDTIRERRCTHFIDDLEEVLLHPDFPSEVVKILYARNDKTAKMTSGLKPMGWKGIKELLFKTDGK